jgi:KUP system potassium uptake protein
MRVDHEGEGGTFSMAQVILNSLEETMKIEDEVEEKDNNNNEILQNNSNSIHTTHPPSAAVPGNSYRRKNTVIMTLAIISASFLIGDAVITAPNTVLGALTSPVLNVSVDLNAFISILILLLTFAVQRFGSKVIGCVSGPLMMLWFITLLVLGVQTILRYPEEARFLLRAFNPACLTAFSGSAGNPIVGFKNGFLSLSGVILCVTGAEALYADLGHFGYRSTVIAWCTVVFPALATQYFGQCCYVISLGRDGERYPPSDYETTEYQALVQQRELFNTNLIEIPSNLVYALVPTDDLSDTAGQACLWLLTIIAILASIIASQALISGLFSLLQQAYALDLVPRMTIVHANPDEKGQVYISEVNNMMCTATVLIVILFKTSDKLVSAYGIAVAVTMFLTDILMAGVSRYVWKLQWTIVVILCLPFVFVDALFLSSNLIKLSKEGISGFTSIIIAFISWLFLQSYWFSKSSLKWATQVKQLNAKKEEMEKGRPKDDGSDPLHSDLISTATLTDIGNLLRLLKESKVLKRMPVAGVFMTGSPQTPPSSLSVLARSMSALPETIIMLHISFSRSRPFVNEHERYDLYCHSEELGVYSLNMYFGYCEPIGPENFDLNNSLFEIFEFESYDDLQKLTEVSFNECPDKVHLWTYIFGMAKYQPHANENRLVKLFVYTADFLNRNSRANREFYGLTNFDTIEIGSVTTICSKVKKE